MSCRLIESSIIKKTCKEHSCEYCGRTIPKGSQDIKFCKFNIDGEIENDYVCHWCRENFIPYSEEWNFSGDIVEMFEENDTIPGGLYFGGADGDYFIFKDRETDKEVKRVYCPIIKEEVK